MAKQKETTEDKATSNSQLSSILQENKGQHYNFQERVNWKISTGSLLLDLAVGGGITPSLIRLCGINSGGKTSMSLEIIRNFLNTVENSKCLWIIAEGRGLSKENTERCGLKFVYSPDEWEIGTVFVLESNVYELFVKCIKELVLNNEEHIKYAFVVDSIDGLQLDGDREKEITENNKVAGVPALSKKMLQSLSLGMFKFGHLMILISQVTSQIKVDPYAKTADRGGNFSGGNALLHASDFILEYQSDYNSDYILDNPNGKLNDGKSKPIGKYAKVVLVKSAVEKSRRQLVQYPVKYGRKPSGIWLEYEVVDMLLSWEFIKKSGAWLSFDDSIISELKTKDLDLKKQHQGLDNLRIYLEENPKITNYFVEKFKNTLGGLI